MTWRGLRFLQPGLPTLRRARTGVHTLALSGLLAFASVPALAESVRLQDMTWPEVSAALRQGTDTVLVPFGGTEQGGSHLILGKHNYIVGAAAEAAARELGGVLVAPVVPLAPAGAYAPADGHMRFAGTLSLRETTYVSLAADIALSLKAHGVPVIVFVADHGQGQDALAELARQLDAIWRPKGTRVLHLAAYHGDNGQRALLRNRGMSDAVIGTHAGVADTAELLYVHPQGVRQGRLPNPSPPAASAGESGGDGDPTRADAELGAEMLALKVQVIVAAITALREAQPQP